MTKHQHMIVYKSYKNCCFILIGLSIGILITAYSNKFVPEINGIYLPELLQNRRSSLTFFQKDLNKLPYQLDYPLNFSQIPKYARLPKPPCRSFGEWIKNLCDKNHLNNAYIDYTLFDLINLFSSNKEYSKLRSRYIINGGSHDDTSLDMLYEFFSESKYPGIIIESSKNLYEKLKVNLLLKNIIKLNIDLEPDTVYKLFIDNKVPFRAFILKIDIGAYDYIVMRSIFFHKLNNSRTEFQPAIILVEMNEKIPPPIHFYTRYRSYYKYDHLYGTSITSWTHLLSFQLGYVLLGIYNWNNLIYIHYDFAKHFNLLYKFPHNSYDVWLHGFWNRNHRNEHFI
jgi:hypothetical protein